MDAYSRRILGYKVSDTMETKSFIDALTQAKATRMRTILPSVIFHLGHGS